MQDSAAHSKISSQQIQNLVERHFAGTSARRERADFLSAALAEFIGADTLSAGLEAFSRLKRWSDEEFPSHLENLLELIEAEPELRAGFQRAVRRDCIRGKDCGPRRGGE